MPEVRVNYSENLPGEQYKSRRFTVELTEQVNDIASVPRCTAVLFELAKKEVAYQMSMANGKPAVATNGANSNAQDHPASPKQVACVFAIGKSLNLTREDLEKFTGVSLSSKTLTSREASKVIEYLKGQQRQAA